nr:MAG TPA: hypothetical protein [Caudoviricetes sp.]
MPLSYYEPYFFVKIRSFQTYFRSRIYINCIL